MFFNVWEKVWAHVQSSGNQLKTAAPTLNQLSITILSISLQNPSLKFAINIKTFASQLVLTCSESNCCKVASVSVNCPDFIFADAIAVEPKLLYFANSVLNVDALGNLSNPLALTILSYCVANSLS